MGMDTVSSAVEAAPRSRPAPSVPSQIRQGSLMSISAAGAPPRGAAANHPQAVRRCDPGHRGRIVGAGDGEPERAAHRAPQRLPPERVGAADGDHPGRAARLDRADDRSGVAGVLDPAQPDDQRPRGPHGLFHRGGTEGGEGDEAARRRGRAQRVHHRRGHPNDAGGRFETAGQGRDPGRRGRRHRRDVHTHPCRQGVLHQPGAFQEHGRAGRRVAARGAPEARHERVAPAGDRFHGSGESASGLAARAGGSRRFVGSFPCPAAGAPGAVRRAADPARGTGTARRRPVSTRPGATQRVPGRA